MGDKARRTHRIDSEKLAAMEAIGKKRWRVEVELRSVAAFTIWATDEDEAVELVMTGKGGLHAGVEPPVPVAAAAFPYGGTEDVGKEARIIENAETEENPNTQGIIEVVK